MSFRTDNEPFKKAMQGFTAKVVNLLKSHNLIESQDGPIILARIENEYGKRRIRFGQEGYNYMTWATKMAVSMQTGVPWVMCKDAAAPDHVTTQEQAWKHEAYLLFPVHLDGTLMDNRQLCKLRMSSSQLWMYYKYFDR